MKDKINLDFCVLENPINNDNNPIIFVTRQNKSYLDPTIIQEDEYEKAIYAIQELGYIESDILTFEFSQDPDFPIIGSKSIIKELKKRGMKYNEKLELSLIDDFDEIRGNNTANVLQSLQDNINNKDLLKEYVKKKKSIFKIPKVGEKISLYFYLFIECKFKGDNCFLNLNGDFFSNKETKVRNYIQTIKCDFIRVNNTYNPNKIILKSSLNNEELIKKIKIFKNGSFVKEEGLVNKTFAYHIMEIKDSIPKLNRISIEISDLNNYENMILVSRQIKQKQKLSLEGTVKKSVVLRQMDECNEILQNKMITLANSEEYEKAQAVKEDIKKVNRKTNKIKKEDDNISLKILEKKYQIG